MKKYYFAKFIILTTLYPFSTIDIKAQVSELSIQNTNLPSGNYVARDKVKVLPQTSHTSGNNIHLFNRHYTD